MKKNGFIFLFLSLYIGAFAQNTYSDVVFETSEGNMVLELYAETPFHSENFLKLVNEGYYNGQLFHRVISEFMIQAGDPNSKNAKPNITLGNGGPGYTIPAEFNINFYHKRGALAAARMGDNVNPKKESSGSQFYIVQGKVFNLAQLNTMVQQGMHVPFSNDQIEIYTTVGGSPHLDYEYTVFGELIEGFDVLSKIAAKPTDRNSRPLDDVIIIKAYTRKK